MTCPHGWAAGPTGGTWSGRPRPLQILVVIIGGHDLDGTGKGRAEVGRVVGAADGAKWPKAVARIPNDMLLVFYDFPGAGLRRCRDTPVWDGLPGSCGSHSPMPIGNWLSARERSRQPKPWEHGVLKAGHGADPVAGEGEYVQADPVADAGRGA